MMGMFVYMDKMLYLCALFRLSVVLGSVMQGIIINLINKLYVKSLRGRFRVDSRFV